jgi:hypothetical protein
MKTYWWVEVQLHAFLDLGTTWRWVVNFKQLRAEWPGVRVPEGAKNFSLHRTVQTDSGALPASYTEGTRGSFPGIKAPGAWNW